MDYQTLKSIIDSGHGDVFCKYVTDALDRLRRAPIDPNLPAEEYKVNALGRDFAVETLEELLQPFLTYEVAEKRVIPKDSIYFSHQPKRPVHKRPAA